MSRNGGFLVRDRDTGYLRDPKVIRAVRVGGLGAAILYDAVVDASWAAGRRATVEEALDGLPRVYSGLGDKEADALKEAGLLDTEGRVPEAVWANWYEEAAERRLRLQKAAKKGADARWNPTADATAMRPHSDGNGPPMAPVRPSVRPSDRPSIAREADPATGQGRPASRGETPTFDFNAVRPAWMGAKKEPVT